MAFYCFDISARESATVCHSLMLKQGMGEWVMAYRNHLQHSASCASAQVDGLAPQLWVVYQLLYCGHMALGQVHHMDVVTHSCTVTCVVVTAIHIQLWPDARGHLLNVGHQVVGDPNGMLSNQACKHEQMLLLPHAVTALMTAQEGIIMSLFMNSCTLAGHLISSVF